MTPKIAALATLLSVAFCASAADDVTYRKNIQPLVKAQCEACHGAQSPALAEFLADDKKYAELMIGPRLSSYGDLIALIGWPDPGALMRRLDDGTNAGGKAGNMYVNLGASDEERKARLALIKAWVGEGAWNLNRWEQRGDVPGITKDQLDKLKIKY